MDLGETWPSWAVGTGREWSGLTARCSAGWGAGRQMKGLVLQVVVALGSRICTSSALRSVFWGPGSTAGVCEYLCLSAMVLPQQQTGMGELQAEEMCEP